MMNFILSTNCSAAKIKAEAKSTMTDMLIEKLSEMFGTENVAMVRVGNSSKMNEIGVRIGTVAEGDETYDLCVTVNATTKEFMDRKASKKTYTKFDFDVAKNEYITYMEEKNTKEKEKTIAKVKKIERDTIARAEV